MPSYYVLYGRSRTMIRDERDDNNLFARFRVPLFLSLSLTPPALLQIKQTSATFYYLIVVFRLDKGAIFHRVGPTRSEGPRSIHVRTPCQQQQQQTRKSSGAKVTATPLEKCLALGHCSFSFYHYRCCLCCVALGMAVLVAEGDEAAFCCG